MLAICRANRIPKGKYCKNNLYDKEFEVVDIDNGRCPICCSNVAPAWIKDYRIDKEEKLRKEILDCVLILEELGENIMLKGGEK